MTGRYSEYRTGNDKSRRINKRFRIDRQGRSTANYEFRNSYFLLEQFETVDGELERVSATHQIEARERFIHLPKTQKKTQNLRHWRALPVFSLLNKDQKP